MKSEVVGSSNHSPRVVLRSVTDARYYSASGTWVSNPAKARNFGESPEAIRFAHENGLDDVELVFSYGDPALDVSFVLHPKQSIAQPLCWLETVCLIAAAGQLA